MTERDRSRFALSLGAHVWPALAGLKSSIGGEFKDWGLDLEISAHFRTRRGGKWMMGGDLGLFYTESSIPGETANLSARGLYAVPSVVFQPTYNSRFHLHAGLGLYVADFAELDCASVNPCVQVAESWESVRPGGYVGVGIPVLGSGTTGIAGAIAVKMHLFDFGTPDGIGPAPGRLRGPLIMALAGISWPS